MEQNTSWLICAGLMELVDEMMRLSSQQAARSIYFSQPRLYQHLTNGSVIRV